VKHVFSRFLLFMSLAYLVANILQLPSALAQTETGQITGTITDATGAVVSGAKVEVKSPNTGLTREIITASGGTYTISGLKPDVYDVTVEASGFQKFVRRASVTVGSITEVSVQLTVGGTSQIIEVTGTTEAVTVNTENQTLSETITSRQIDLLPTSPTRNPYALVGTSGNVAEDNSMSNRGTGFAINGQRSASTDILLDGAENVDTFTASVGQTVPLDSVQEFSVLTSNFTAEYGRASGGVVNLVTKSGTNAFHGSAYEYNRVSALSANTFQNDVTDTPKGVFTRNDFGFSLGGPAIKNKLFFFNNTEWIRVRSASPTFATIIDPGSIASLAPASQAYFAAYGTLASGVQTIASGPCSTVANSPTCDTVAFSAPSDAGGGSPQNTTMEVARVDWNISDRTTLFGRYASYKELDFPGTVNASPYVGYNTGQTNYDQNYSVNLTHVFTPRLVNTAKATFNRLNGPVQPLSTAPIGPSLYSAGSLPSVTIAGNSQSLIFPGYSEFTPGNAIPFGGPQNLYQFYDDVSWTLGKHQVKFGGQFIQLRDNRVFGAYENPVELLGTNLDSGITNLINGEIYQFQGAVYPQGKFPCPKDASGVVQVSPECTLNLPVGPPAFNRNYHYNDGAVYAQDSFKILPRFTLNLGLRWEYYGVQHNANESLDSNFVLGSGSTIFDQIRNGSVKLAKDGGVFWKPQYHNFGPRVGFAWDVFGNGKTSLRGGYAISYERNFGNVTFNAIQNPPNYAVISLQSFVDVAGALPVFTDTAGPLAGSGTKPLPAVSQRAINQNLRSAYSEAWNLSVDRQVGKGVFSVAYAGSNGIHLYDIANVNPAKSGSAFLGDARVKNRLNYQYSNMNFRSDNGLSRYDALNLKYAVVDLGHRGLGISANYTYSHALDNLSSTFSDGSAGFYQLGYLDAFNPRLNFGNADFDIRHRFSLAATWEVPWMKNSSNAFARHILGGWGMGTILSIRSGSPFSIYDCNDFNGTSCPQYIPPAALARTGSPKLAGTNLYNYIPLATEVFTDPDTGDQSLIVSNQGVSLGIPTCTGLNHVGCTYTTDGSPYPARNQFFGPGFWNLDMNFYKTFKLTERFGLQFRGEFYNLFNHHNQYITNGNLDVSSISQSCDPLAGCPNVPLFIQTEKGGPSGSAGTSTDERRNIQLGLRLTF
jgi:outer membrane receptor protein involved in Fe transport